MKSRGGQPGNTNALKHGYYSRRLSELDSSDLDSAMQAGLADEIAMLRVTMRKVFEGAIDLGGEGETALERWASLLGLLSSASAKLAAMLRTQKLIMGTDQQSETLNALQVALRKVNNEFRQK